MRSVAIAMVLATACGKPDRVCGAGDFVYRDRACGAPLPGGTSTCSDVGDGLCHLRCASDADCPAETAFCRTLGLYSGGDFNCNSSVTICRAIDRDDCRAGLD
jgi:hypothetical protein